jgi:hypothetical protein
MLVGRVSSPTATIKHRDKENEDGTERHNQRWDDRAAVAS